MSVEQEQNSMWNTAPKCRCGAPRKAWRPLCADCSRAQRPGWNSATPEAKRRANARSFLNSYLRRGKIAKQPCADCGAVEVEAHHADYSRPLDVTWLCRECHVKRHGIVCQRVRRGSKADEGKPAALYAFYDLLHGRAASTDTIARELSVSGAVVRKLIGGLRPRRGPTWRRMVGLLRPIEVALLTGPEVTAWAERQSAKRPKWTPEKAAMLTA